MMSIIQRCCGAMSTKGKTLDRYTINKIVASRLGLEVSEVNTVIKMQEKVILEHLKKGFAVKLDDFLEIAVQNRKAYEFKAGLDRKTYHVSAKTNVKITPANWLVRQIKLGDNRE